MTAANTVSNEVNSVLEPDRADIQGLILRGYTHPYSCHFLVKFSGQESLKQLIAALYPFVQNAVDWGTNKPKSMLNIGLTYQGLQQASVLNPSDLATFPSEFVEGPWSPQSQASLLDYGASGPSNWWYQNFNSTDLHGVIHAYALTAADLEALTAKVLGAIQSSGTTELFPLAGSEARLIQSQLPDGEIHFGYRDGISNPPLTPSNDPPDPHPDEGDLSNFLIGYSFDTSSIQPGPTQGAAGSFARNGCYNAFRILYQDVATFNQFLVEQAAAVASHIGRTPDQAQEWIAAKVVGRWRNGSPLMLSPEAPDPATRDGEAFLYGEPGNPSKDVDSVGKCPFAAHTRVSNPRDEPLTSIEGASPPRILRRGVPYGPRLDSSSDDGVDRGLIGLFLCGSPARQFEKIYGWMNAANMARDFNPYPTPQDALLGNRYTGGNSGLGTGFTIPIPTVQDPSGTFQCPAMPQFIQTRGTAYCLLPSLTTLRLMAGL